MQLFSIGLYLLNQDGTRKIDPATGQPIATYTNEDIVNFSRGWTNFKERETERDNIEAEWSTVSISTVCRDTIFFNDFSNTDFTCIVMKSQDWMVNKIDPMFLPTSEGRGEACTFILWRVVQFEKLTDFFCILQMSFLN
jgi:hypothetical protein